MIDNKNNGSHLLLDIDESKLDLANTDNVKETVKTVLASQNINVIDCFEKQVESRQTSFYLLENGHLTMLNHQTENKLTIDMYLHTQNSKDTLNSVKKALSEKLSEQQHVSEMLLDRGTPFRWLNINDDLRSSQLFQGVKVLYSGNSPFQKIEVIEHPWLERSLILDEIVMFSIKFQDMYSPALSVPVMDNALNFSKQLDLLVIGGGDGIIADWMVKNRLKDVNSVTFIEIDKMVSDVCQKYFPNDTVFEHEKVKYVYEDAIEWVKKADTSKMYDGVIIDSTDPTMGISFGLFSVEFYSNLKRLMKEGAMISQQCDIGDYYVKLLPMFEETKLTFKEVKKYHTVEYNGEITVIYLTK